MLVGVDSPFTDIIAGASLSLPHSKVVHPPLLLKIFSLWLDWITVWPGCIWWYFFFSYFISVTRCASLLFIFSSSSFWWWEDRVKSVDRRYTFSSFPPLLNAQRAVVGRSGPITFPGIGPSVLCVREAGALGGNGGRKELKNENWIYLFIYYSYRFSFYIFVWCFGKLNSCIFVFSSFGGCQFPDGFHVPRWSQANQSRRTLDSGSVGSYPHLDAVRHLLLVAGKNVNSNHQNHFLNSMSPFDFL